MKFARGLLFVSWVSVSFPLAIACGSGGSSNLFSSTGGATSLSRAGANGVAAGTSTAGADSSAGTGAGGSSEGGASAGERGVAGKGSGGVTEPNGGGPGAGGKGHGGAPSGGSPGAGGAGAGGASAGGSATAGAGGGTAGSGGSTGGTGGIVGGNGGNGGTSGSGNGEGCPVNGAPTPGAACQVTTPDSCFYSGVACSCQQSGPSAFGRRWACYGTPDKCPDNAPAPGSGPCKTGAQCPYPGGNFCACVAGGNGGGNEPKFACQPDAPVCPDMKPFTGMGCQLPVRSCAYADDQCFCDGDNWTCESN